MEENHISETFLRRNVERPLRRWTNWRRF